MIRAALILASFAGRRVWAAALGGFIVIAVVWPVEGKKYATGKWWRPQLTLYGYTETKLNDVHRAGKNVPISRPSPKELSTSAVNQKIIDMGRRDIHGPTGNFGRLPEHEGLLPSFLNDDAELKISGVLNPSGADQGINGASGCSAGILPRNPQSQCPNNPVLIGQELMLGLKWKNMSALNNAAVFYLPDGHESQNESGESQETSKNVQRRVAENQIFGRGTGGFLIGFVGGAVLLWLMLQWL